LNKVKEEEVGLGFPGGEILKGEGGNVRTVNKRLDFILFFPFYFIFGFHFYYFKLK